MTTKDYDKLLIEDIKDILLSDYPLSLREQLLDDILEDYIPCLLYTSPSPRDLSTSRMPSSA